MPTPNEDESRDDFVSRCIPIVLGDGTAEDQDQAVAICNSMWEEANKEQGKMSDKMEHKTVSGFVTKADEAQGIIECFFAIFGNIDQGDDIIHPGAFTKTFAERGGKVKVLDAHRTDSIMRAIAKPPLMLREARREELPAELLTKHPDAAGGAFAKVQMLMDTPEGRGAFIRLRDKAVDEWSFGYDVLDVDFSQAMKDGKEITVRNLRTLKLYEISAVLFGMNEATTTVSAKADDGDKTASGATNLPIADRARAWDATAAVKRVRTLTGSAEAPSRSYRTAFFWYAGDEPDSFGSYKLPFCDIIDGKLTAIPRGIFAAAAVMQGARGGADVGGDTEAVKGRIAGYYGRMRRQFDDDSIVAPWNKAADVDIEVQILEILAKHGYAPAISQVATDNQDDEQQAGPEQAPPTSSVLDQITLLELEIEQLEASYDEE